METLKRDSEEKEKSDAQLLDEQQPAGRNPQDTHASSHNNQGQSGDIASTALSVEQLSDKLALISDEVDYGHYYSDTCQFHSNYR